MKKYRDKDFREALQHISTSELDAILQEELRNVPVNQGSVKIILRELKAREKDNPVKNGVESGKSWVRYLSQMKNDERSEKRNNGRVVKGVAAAMLAVVLLVWLPQEAAAKGFFERISRWTDEFLELFSPDAVNENQYEYVFTTDNPGLQKVHDAVVEMGVTGPAVPMWLPEGYELVELKQELFYTNKSVNAGFSNGSQELRLQFNIYTSNIDRKIYKDEEIMMRYEYMGVLFEIISNKERKLVFWSKDNCEFCFSVECPEEVIYRIINSIFTEEANNHEEIFEATILSYCCSFVDCSASPSC